MNRTTDSQETKRPWYRHRTGALEVNFDQEHMPSDFRLTRVLLLKGEGILVMAMR